MLYNPEQSFALSIQLEVERSRVTSMLEVLRHEHQWCKNVLQEGFFESKPVLCMLGAATFVTLPPDNRPSEIIEAILDDSIVEKFILVRLTYSITKSLEFEPNISEFVPQDIANASHSELSNAVADFNDCEATTHSDVVNVLLNSLMMVEADIRECKPNFYWVADEPPMDLRTEEPDLDIMDDFPED